MGTPDTVRIEWLGNRVGGIARPPDSPAVFVRGALPGETVHIRRLAEKKSFIEAEPLSIEDPSPHRREPFCPHFGICGGCSLQHLEYSRELYWKREWVIKALRGLEHPQPEGTLPSPETVGYRNRVTFDVHRGKLHLHAFRGDPIPVDECPLMNENASVALRELLASPIPLEARRISVRGSLNTPDRAVEIHGNGSWKRISPATFRERILDIEFPVPPGGFFQVNTGAAEVLSSVVGGMIPGSSGTVLDLYGGVGTFGIPLALRGFTVESVEMNPGASRGCREAAQTNAASSMLKAINLRDRSYLSSALSGSKKFDILITDPPRAGMGIRTTRQIARLKPPQIVYVSCNPFSAARDIAILTRGGYTISKIIPVDMFPNTDHVETVFLLKGKDQ